MQQPAEIIKVKIFLVISIAITVLNEENFIKHLLSSFTIQFTLLPELQVVFLGG